MIRSLRWRLQLWHAAVLTIVLIMFGGIVYALQWQTRLQQTDAELDRVASVLTSRLRGLFPVPRMPGPGPWAPRSPGRGGPQGRGGDERPSEFVGPPVILERPNAGGAASSRDDSGAPREENKDESGDNRRRDRRGNLRGGPPDGSRDSTRDGFRPDGPRDGGRDSQGAPRFGPPPGLGLPDEFNHLFEGDDENSFYFLIWDRNGTVLEKSKSVEDIPFPDLHTQSDGLPVRVVRTRDMHREVVHVSRFEINVLVGRSLKRDVAALNRSGLLLGLTGLGVLAIGLAGGWWFSSRAIRPIAEMTEIAESISIKNLSNRINIQSTATELEQLGIVLNHTFDRLQSAFERQSQFTADASHELRTPLSVILSHAELALARKRTPEEYQAAFNVCRRASLRMKALIDALLLLARFDSTEPELEIEKVNLDLLSREAVEMLQPLAAERQIELNCDAAEVFVLADPEQMFQVLTNLLSNAIRYNRPGGRVNLRVTVEDQSAVIRVTDTGVGISADDLPKIFDRFFRVDKARSQAEGGCGLGLSICRTIVEAHRGTIAASSELQVGTTIEIRLPIFLPCDLNRSPDLIDSASKSQRSSDSAPIQSAETQKLSASS